MDTLLAAIVRAWGTPVDHVLIVKWAIHFAGWKMNKQLWSPSYVFMMAGSTGMAHLLLLLA